MGAEGLGHARVPHRVYPEIPAIEQVRQAATKAVTTTLQFHHKSIRAEQPVRIYTNSQKDLRIFLSSYMRPSATQNAKKFYTRVIFGLGIITFNEEVFPNIRNTIEEVYDNSGCQYFQFTPADNEFGEGWFTSLLLGQGSADPDPILRNYYLGVGEYNTNSQNHLRIKHSSISSKFWLHQRR